MSALGHNQTFDNRYNQVCYQRMSRHIKRELFSDLVVWLRVDLNLQGHCFRDHGHCLYKDHLSVPRQTKLDKLG